MKNTTPSALAAAARAVLPRITIQNASAIWIRCATLLLVLWAMPATVRGQIFETNAGDNTIGEYTTSGATVNASLITTGLSAPYGIAVSGSNLFVTNVGNNTIGEYTMSGATLNASLITGLSAAIDIAVSGTNLFVVNSGTDTVGEYTTSGPTVNGSLVSGLNIPYGIAVVPEPSSMALAGLAAAGLAVPMLRRRRAGRP